MKYKYFFGQTAALDNFFFGIPSQFKWRGSEGKIIGRACKINNQNEYTFFEKLSILTSKKCSRISGLDTDGVGLESILFF